MKVGIIGTGLMGYPMAINIAKKYELKAFNRTFDKMKGLEKYKINLCSTLDNLSKDTDVIISMLPGDEEVLETVSHVKKNIKPNSVFVDMSSTKVSTANESYKALKEINSHFIDAPVSGGPEGAKSGSLAIMAGGEQDIFLKIKPILETMGKSTLLGRNGSGQVAKLCNQIIVNITIGAVAEAILLCEKNGTDPSKFITAVSGGFADSKILKIHGKRMIDKNFIAGGKNITLLKDMTNILDSASEKNLNLPISKLIRNMFKNLCDAGLENDDHSSLYKEILNNDSIY
jgi:2-hydroxy-3-oxopropionate reductase